ncbi:MAG: SUMF1/EgtB/PvdO family nonheme iron enzyme [Acidobacteriia bacterium]|nr:SUMF1/EgtB/PvdO family nonheme iron enzyme [Terriglobia bacterium]
MLATYDGISIRHGLIERLCEARRQSDALFSLVRADYLYERPIPERHRIVFYVGHLEAFDWNLLHENIFGLKSFHPEFDRLFAFGIDPVGGGLPSDRPSDWPSLDQVHDYVTKVRAALDEKLAGEALRSQTPDGSSIETLLNVAVEHRLMHVETLAYMLHQLALDKKVRQRRPQNVDSGPVVHRMVEIPAGMATLGLRRGSEDFGWDNEYEAHTVDVPAFAIDQYKVTNRQYLAFMVAGGYEVRSFWSDDDWNWRTGCGITHPVFWKKAGDRWLYRTMFDEAPLPLDWPVYVSHAEASAYARWAGKSLPTEAEWHRAAYGVAGERERTYPWGSEPPNTALGNFDFHRGDPTRVNAFPAGRSAFGVHDVLGNGWEWTSTVLAPFSGFEPFPFYRGYSADFFDGKHFVMKGGSARTAACMLRPTFRNWFQAHYQYAYTGFRCVSH